MQEYIKPKKRLGQNFLFDKNVQNKIISSCELSVRDTVLEIGAGRGELTGLIADKVSGLSALEIDPALYKILKKKFKDDTNVRVIHQDILRFDLKKYYCGINSRVKVIGNIPYYITSPIIEHLLQYKNLIGSIYLTVQKEFAQRMTAHAPSRDWGRLSCFIQYYTQPKILFPIRKTSFFPAPKVDSVFIKLELRREPLVNPKNERLFFKTIRSAFSQRRKVLKNSLRGVISQEKLSLFFKKYNIKPKIRPEALTLADFSNLTWL